MSDINYTYIVQCNDGTYYTGWTNDIIRRLHDHNAGKGRGAKYTRARLPVKLVYLEVKDTKREAMSREAYIKRLTRAAKIDLINNNPFKEGEYDDRESRQDIK